MAAAESERVLKDELQDKNHGLAKAFRLLRNGRAVPLLCAERNKPGPNGEPVGTVTTSPKEVDQSAIDKWSEVY